MLSTLKSLFGIGPSVNYKELVQNGAQIIDVRSPSEFSGGHVKGSLNIPLDGLERQLSKIKKDKVVITVCASGMRSSIAKSKLKSLGYAEVHNGGAWVSLQSKIK